MVSAHGGMAGERGGGTLAVILSHYVFVGGCGSDNGRNFVAATATGLADSLVVEFFVVAEYMAV